MDFEKNRQQILDNLSKVKREKTVAKRAAVKSSVSGTTLAEAAIREKKCIILFGKQTFFLRSITSTLGANYRVEIFDNPEKACDFCLDNQVNFVFLDMDEPTDWRMSTDLFTTVKTVNPSISFFQFTARPAAVEVQTLEAQGAEILQKPVSLDSVKEALKRSQG